MEARMSLCRRGGLAAVVFFTLLLPPGPNLNAQPTRDASRGELLYTTHCISCHNADMHWREKLLVTDWKSLRMQVRRWQSVVGLGWGEQDIAEVAQYLNAHYYHLPAEVSTSQYPSGHVPARTPGGP